MAFFNLSISFFPVVTHQTPVTVTRTLGSGLVSNNGFLSNAGFVSNAGLVSNVGLVSSAPAVTAARTLQTTSNVAASPSLFQTADGRFFAFNNAASSSAIAPGQFFQVRVYHE